jgi:hypothetical protein
VLPTYDFSRNIGKLDGLLLAHPASACCVQRCMLQSCAGLVAPVVILCIK